jgi:hypothetical protein
MSEWATMTPDDVRTVARELLELTEREIALRRERKEAALRLVQAAEKVSWPKLLHAVTQEAAGLMHDVDEEEIAPESMRDQLIDFLELVDVAATAREVEHV